MLTSAAGQDDGYIFLWVTGRAMELSRELLKARLPCSSRRAVRVTTFAIGLGL